MSPIKVDEVREKKTAKLNKDRSPELFYKEDLDEN